MTLTRGTGWRPDRVHRRVAGRIATSARRLGALYLPEKGGVALSPWLRLDQGRLEACTGFTGVQLIYGLSGRKTSPFMLWYYARVRDGEDPRNPRNIGVRSRAMISAYRRHGSCPYAEWNDSVAGFDVDAAPPFAERLAGQKNNLRTASLYGWGNSLVELVVDSLARGYPVGIVVRVTRNFLDARSNVVGPEDGPDLGGHIVCGWSFERVAGAYVINCVNSWGDHADGGIVRLSAERVGQSPLCVVGKAVD